MSDEQPPRARPSTGNAVLGVVVTGLLTGALGYGTYTLFRKSTPTIGIDEGMYGFAATLLAAFLGAAITAWRGHSRHSRPVPEGTIAGFVGFTVAATGIAVPPLGRDLSPLQILQLLPNLLWGIPAAYAGALLGVAVGRSGTYRHLPRVLLHLRWRRFRLPS